MYPDCIRNQRVINYQYYFSFHVSYFCIPSRVTESWSYDQVQNSVRISVIYILCKVYMIGKPMMSHESYKSSTLTGWLNWKFRVFDSDFACTLWLLLYDASCLFECRLWFIFMRNWMEFAEALGADKSCNRVIAITISSKLMPFFWTLLLFLHV